MTMPLTFSTKTILDRAWETLKQHWAFLLGAWLIIIVISGFAGAIQAAAQQNDGGLLVILSFGLQIFSFWLGIGLMRLLIKVARGEVVELSELWTGGPYLWQYFVGMLVVGIVSFVGFLLLIIPGIIWGLTYMFTQFILADEKISFSVAMAQSKEMTQGIKWKLLGFGAILFGVNLIGCLPFFLGLIVTVPITTLASYVLYVELRKQYLAQVKLEKAPEVKPTGLKSGE